MPRIFPTDWKTQLKIFEPKLSDFFNKSRTAETAVLLER
jgi:hypothetical protein